MQKLKHACFMLLLFAVLFAAQVAAQPASSVVMLEIEGPVTPAMAAYFERGIAQAERSGAQAVVITLDTPGGGLRTTQEIVQTLRRAAVPVIVYVGPPGAQAASAGSLITLAAHAAGMAPETVIGAASPVGPEGQDIEDTLYRKAVEDMKATMRGLAERRGETAVALAEAMIEDARAVNANEALEAGLIDAVAPDATSLLTALDGTEVIVADEPWTLQTAQAVQVEAGMNLLEQTLHLLADSAVISILLALAVPAILIELQSPGGWVAGFVGVLSLGLALYGLGQLPVNWLGLGLVAAAFALFLLEVKSPGVGALALVGTLTLLAGLLLLFNSPGTPEFARISIPSAVAITLATSGFFLLIVTLAVKAQRAQALTGQEGLIGQTGRVRKAFVPSPAGDVVFEGSVLVNGELWRARASEAIATDMPITVKAIEGFTLFVEKAPSIIKETA